MRLSLALTAGALFLTGCGPKDSPKTAEPGRPPRGLILVIGDGMGPGQTQLLLSARPEGALSALYRSGTIGLVDTTPEGALVTDSAAGGTALATGVKTRPRMLAVDPDGYPAETLLEAAARLGRATGIVTTNDLTDATPAAFLAHSASRLDKAEIARQIARKPPTAAVGGGARWLSPPPPGLTALAPEDLPMRTQGPRPSLAELTARALAAIEDAPGGYVLVVEAARIDVACHAHDAAGLLGELEDLDDALAPLAARAERGEALLVVTADHETGGFGFTYRSTLPDGRAAGPGPTTLPSGERWDPKADFVPPDVIGALRRGESPYQIAWSTYSHTGAPVPLAAIGPGAERFGGFSRQFEIGLRLREAIGAGPPRVSR